MGAFVRGEENKRHIGVFLHMKPSEGGSFQYEEFILDALSECDDEYVTTVIYDSHYWEKVLSHRYPSFSGQFVRFSYDDMCDEIDSLGLDYLIIPSYGPDHGFEARFRTPVIAAFHDFMYYFEPEGKMWDNKKFSYLLQAICFRSVGIFVDSDLGKQHCLHVLGHMYAEKVATLPFRVPNYLYEEHEKTVSLKWEKYIFYPSQLWPHKNHLNLILALDMLRQEGIFVNLVFTGAHSGIYEYVLHLLQKLALKDQVEILSYVSGAEMKYLFHHARAMVMASYAGATNIPPLEAMECGCPVAIADVYAMPWQVGDAGICFEPKSVEDIANALKRLWIDDALCRELSERGKKQVQKFSKGEFGKKFRSGMKQMTSFHEKRYEHLQLLAMQCRTYGKIYLYGAGAFGAMVCNYLYKNNVTVTGFVVTSKPGNPEKWYGYPVYALDEVKTDLQDAFIIVSVDPRKQEDIVSHLKDSSVRNIHQITRDEWSEAYTYFVMPS